MAENQHTMAWFQRWELERKLFVLKAKGCFLGDCLELFPDSVIR